MFFYEKSTGKKLEKEIKYNRANSILNVTLIWNGFLSSFEYEFCWLKELVWDECRIIASKYDVHDCLHGESNSHGLLWI